MASFGTLLQQHRKAGRNPNNLKRMVSQTVFARLIADEIGAQYSAQQIGNWERDEYAPNANDRELILAIVKALYRCGGITSWREANELLAAGNYKELDRDEIGTITPKWIIEAADEEPIAPAVISRHSIDQLRRYLPAHLQIHVDSGENRSWNEAQVEQLNALLRTLTTYVPRHLVIPHLDSATQQQSASTFGNFLYGTLVFADISGFTALSEDLWQRYGNEGAEHLTDLINRFLDTLLGILYRYNGKLIKFGGDAMLCLFDGDDAGAHAAVMASWDMKAAITTEFQNVTIAQEITRLDMTFGQNSGQLFQTVVGNASHLEYFLTGRVVEQTSQASSSARPGEIIMGRHTYELLKSTITAADLAKDEKFFRLEALNRKHAHTRTQSWPGIELHLDALSMRSYQEGPYLLLERLDSLARYLPSGVLAELVQQPHDRHMMGQHRRITVIFANFIGISEIIEHLGQGREEDIQAVIAEFFTAMQEVIQYYGGVTNKVDLYDQGDKLMIIFGAPFAHEQDTRRAALTAIKMMEALHELDSLLGASFLDQKIGIHTGYAYAGNVGSANHHRREYTVIGNTVNIAARLMSTAAPGEIYLSDDVLVEIEDDFQTDPVGLQEIRGLQDPLMIHRLLDYVTPDGDTRRPLRRDAPLLGRHAELDQLIAIADNLLLDRVKQIVGVSGEGGVGKSRLVTEWIEYVEEHMAAPGEIRWITVYGRPYGPATNGMWPMFYGRSSA